MDTFQLKPDFKIFLLQKIEYKFSSGNTMNKRNNPVEHSVPAIMFSNERTVYPISLLLEFSHRRIWRKTEIKIGF